jgi:8-oxo-dGTP pyrophosphatase MutT (NUDIX family)
MNHKKGRRRGTAIVETECGILLVEDTKGMILLPGGQANRTESRFEAAIRELREETGLVAVCALRLFDFDSYTNRHRVVWIKAYGTPVARDDARALHYCTSETLQQLSGPSPATVKILQKFWAYKKENLSTFENLSTISEAFKI